MALGKPGRLRIDQPTITGEFGPATAAYPLFAHADCSFVERLPDRRFHQLFSKACLATWSCITGRTAQDGPTCWSIGHINGFWLKLNRGATN